MLTVREFSQKELRGFHMCQPKERQGGPGFQRGVEFQFWSQTQRAQRWGRVKQGKWKEKSKGLEVLKQPVAGTWMMSQCKQKVGEKWIKKRWFMSYCWYTADTNTEKWMYEKWHTLSARVYGYCHQHLWCGVWLQIQRKVIEQASFCNT